MAHESKGYYSFSFRCFLFNDIKFKAYRHPLLERPLLKTYMISLVWLISILISDWWMISSIGAIDVKLTDEEKKELEAPYVVQGVFGHS